MNAPAFASSIPISYRPAAPAVCPAARSQLAGTSLSHPPSAATPPPTMPAIQAIHTRAARLHHPADQRKALLRLLTTELLRNGRIETTQTWAQAVCKMADHVITLAKEGSLHARRQALGRLYDKGLVYALFEQAPQRYAGRMGGYTRLLRSASRSEHNAPVSIIELI